MAAEPVVEPIVEPVVLWVVPDTIPLTDTPIQYPGMGPHAVWDDVYRYAKSIAHYFSRSGPAEAYALVSQVDGAIDTAIGSTIKSLSGFINQAAQLGVDAQNWASNQLDHLDANIGAIYSYFDHRIGILEATSAAVVRLALPSLQAQIDNLEHNVAQGFRFNSAADRAWALDNIFAPLYEGIFRLKADVETDIGTSADAVRNYVDHMNALQGAHFAELVAPAVALATAANAWIDDCGEPMCQVAGPKTDIGKLLKALKVAQWAAIIAELAALRADGLEGLLSDVERWGGIAINDLETTFFSGGKTLGEALAGIG